MAFEGKIILKEIMDYDFQEAISYFQKIRQFDSDDFALKIPRVPFKRIVSCLAKVDKLISDQYDGNLSSLRIPQWFLENRVGVLAGWKKENALSDTIASSLFQRDINKTNLILQGFLKLLYPSKSFSVFELINISREQTYKVGELSNRDDILIHIRTNGKDKYILIEQKICAPLGENQLRTYLDLSLCDDMDMVVLTSKDSDIAVSDNFKKTLAKSRNRRIYHVTHLDLLKVVLKALEIDPENHFGFLAKWLFEIVYAFRFENCITSQLDFLSLGNSRFGKMEFFNLLLQEIKYGH